MRSISAAVKRLWPLSLALCSILGAGWGAASEPGVRAPFKAVTLVRRYEPGRIMVYNTRIAARLFVQSDSAELNSFLPEIPRTLALRQKDTLTVEKVLRDGSTEMLNRFDTLRILPGRTGTDTAAAREEGWIDSDFSRAITGRVVTVRYDQRGGLLGFSSARPLFQQLEAPSRGPAKLAVRVILAQIGGSGFYPGHPIVVGDTWQKKTVTRVTAVLPALFQSVTTLQYRGLISYRGIQAAAVDYQFTNSLKPDPAGKPSGSLLTLLQSRGASLDFSVTGTGNGRALLALSDGRILRNDSTFQENLRGSLQGFPGVAGPTSQNARVEAHTLNSVQVVEESGSIPR